MVQNTNSPTDAKRRWAVCELNSEFFKSGRCHSLVPSSECTKLNGRLDNLNQEPMGWLEFLKESKLTKRQLQEIRNASGELLKERRRTWTTYRGINRTFTDEEIKLLLNSIESLKWKALFTLLAYTGLRISEAVKLKAEDVFLDKGYLRITTAKQKTKTIDLHPLPSVTIPVVRHYLIKYGTRIRCRGGWLFPQKKHTDKPVSHKTARDVFYYYRDLCGLKRTYAIANDEKNPVSKRIGNRELHALTLHSFRHWYKHKLDRANISYALVRALMRHRSGSVTDMYGSFNIDEKRKAIDTIFTFFL